MCSQQHLTNWVEKGMECPTRKLVVGSSVSSSWGRVSCVSYPLVAEEATACVALAGSWGSTGASCCLSCSGCCLQTKCMAYPLQARQYMFWLCAAWFTSCAPAYGRTWVCIYKRHPSLDTGSLLAVAGTSWLTGSCNVPSNVAALSGTASAAKGHVRWLSSSTVTKPMLGCCAVLHCTGAWSKGDCGWWRCMHGLATGCGCVLLLSGDCEGVCGCSGLLFECGLGWSGVQRHGWG